MPENFLQRNPITQIGQYIQFVWDVTELQVSWIQSHVLGSKLKSTLQHWLSCGHTGSLWGCQWTPIGVTNGRLWTGEFSVHSYGHKVMKSWLDSDYMRPCRTIYTPVTSSSGYLSSKIHGEMLRCVSSAEQWVGKSVLNHLELCHIMTSCRFIQHCLGTTLQH